MHYLGTEWSHEGTGNVYWKLEDTGNALSKSRMEP